MEILLKLTPYMREVDNKGFTGVVSLFLGGTHPKKCSYRVGGIGRFSSSSCKVT
jgi:hypothetical protein